MPATPSLILHHYAPSPFCVAGTPVAADAHEIVLHQTSAEAGDLRLHCPRAGFEVRAA